MAKLFIIPTPIGNLNDISTNQLNALRKSEVIFCEDTRVTKSFLNKIDIETPKLLSYHKYNEKERESTITNIFNKYQNIGLVSNAGAPTISDPGYFIVNKAREMNVQILPIAGPSALINLLMATGIKYDSFTFIGFIKKKKDKIIHDLENANKDIVVFFESPNRILSTLKILEESFPNSYLVIGRELTKLHETFYYGNPNSLLKTVKPKGEFAIMFKNIPDKAITIDNEIIIENLKNIIKLGNTEKDAIKIISNKYNLNKNKIYEIWVKYKSNS